MFLEIIDLESQNSDSAVDVGENFSWQKPQSIGAIIYHFVRNNHKEDHMSEPAQFSTNNVHFLNTRVSLPIPIS